LLALLLLLVNVTGVQNYIAQRAASMLADKLKTRVEVQHVRIDFANHLLLQGLYIEDRNGDTLLYAGEAELRTTDWAFFRKSKPVVTYLGLHHAYGYLNRKANSAEWNYKFVIDAFDTGPKDTTKSSNEFEIDLKHLDFEDLRFHSHDAWTGEDMDIDVGSAVFEGKEIDLKKRNIDLREIDIRKTQVRMRSYAAGRPPRPRSTEPIPVDTTAFNTGNWVIQLGKFRMEDCLYSQDANGNKPLVGLFDENHLHISRIDLNAKNIRIVGDTIRGHVDHVHAQERCGIAIRDMQADVSVSPNASVLKKLLLRTDNSVLRNSYTMRYKRFPDFTDYVMKVHMQAEVHETVVDPHDVAVFAPEFLEYFPVIMKVDGSFDGTVADFEAKNMRYQDVENLVTGNVRMKGLPDIYKTLISVTDAHIVTTGEQLFRFAPMLKDQPGIDFRALKQLEYNGDYQGYIDNFSANGLLTTNLGNLKMRSSLSMPLFELPGARYSTEIETQGFQLGTLLQNPDIGLIAFKGTLSGVGFETQKAALKVDAFINLLDCYGYRYQNVTAKGTLEKERFDGDIQVDDPNLALSFNGTADLSGKVPVMRARAHLLHANLQPLKLTPDSVEASADFDVDAQGNTMDNFDGVALLNNINIYRGGHRLDIDSVRASSVTQADGQKRIQLESNDFTAYVEGRFLLSRLPGSVQYFISRYLPSYIKPPLHAPSDQDLRFSIVTRQIDTLLPWILPQYRGFDNAQINGALNTSTQQVNLNVNVPFATVNSIYVTGLNLKGEGNYDRILLTGEASELRLRDSVLRISLDFKTKIASDSVQFNINTSSPESFGTAAINGSLLARGDSIILNLLPSEFFLNQNRWEVDGGSDVIYRKDFLYVRNFRLHSGSQRINVYSEDELDEQALVLEAEQLDLGQIGAAAGLSGYAPDGRLQAAVRLTDLFRKPSANIDVRADALRLGGDSIGSVFIKGNWDGPKSQLVLNPGTGIFQNNSELRVEGNVTLDSSSNQKLATVLKLRNAPLHWLNPLLQGYVSKLNGSASGDIEITGTGRNPETHGTLVLDQASLHVDYLGTDYRVPSAEIKVTNSIFVLDGITVLDVYDNKAELSGKIIHDRLKNFRLDLNMKSDEFEVLDLKDYEQSEFYGHLVAKLNSMSVRGPIDNIQMNIRAEPADISNLVLPVSYGGDIGSYSYVSFKKYGEDQVIKTGSQSKFTITIDAVINPLAEITLLLDPTTGDAINARGKGSLKLEVPSDGEIRMFGNFNIEEGDYTFTFRQLFFKRQFRISSGSSVHFAGPISQTTLDVSGWYRTRASLYDLLTEQEKSAGFIPDKELSDTKRQQDVDVLLTMRKNILNPEITFKLSLPERRSVGTFAYEKFERLNQNERELFNQVASLLLIGYFIPPEGLGGASAASGTINNLSEILSTNASAQLTNVVNKLLGDPKLSVDLKYKNYNLADNASSSPLNRNEVKLGLRKNLLNDRLVLEMGSAYDWGRPVNTQASNYNFNLLNDFRIQYLLSKDGRVRLNGFRTSDFDALLTGGTNIIRSGVGLSWRWTFNSVPELWQASRLYQHWQQKHMMEERQKLDSTTIKKTIGTQ
jgi:hypothetical protein